MVGELWRDGWLGCTRASLKWHRCPYPLTFSLWRTAITYTHSYAIFPRARARARSPRQAHDTIGRDATRYTITAMQCSTSHCTARRRTSQASHACCVVL